jgi:hypothetical protein
MKNSICYIILVTLSLFILFSCEEILLEKDISNKEVVILAPMENAQFFSTGVTFSWEKLEDATQYHLQIAKPNFSSPLQIVVDTIIASNSFTYQLNVGEYEWRIKGVNSAYETPYKSRFFAIVSNEDFQSNTVILSKPDNNLITNAATQNLSWNTIIGATSYQVQIYDGSNTIISDQTTAVTNFNYAFPEGSLYWKVRASNGPQYTLYSSRSILVDRTNPNTPILSSPLNASTTTVNDITFQWSRTPIAGSVEKDSIYVFSNSTLTTLKLKDEASSPLSKALESGTYFWYVKSFDQAGNYSSRSNLFSFTIN